ncbi:MAG: hypothetical protein O3B74_12065, partial [Proteobacteria bacterium]|nr:hypothetical protein [Pseudomonadota bacterium]
MVSDQELAITSKTLRARAELCAAEKDWAGAARFSRRMLMLSPASAVSWRFFAAVSDRLGDFGSIVKGFRRALLVNPASPTLTHDFALVERQNDRHAAAFQLCRRSICAAPQTINGYLTAGATAYDKSKLDRAWPMFLRARTIQPDNLTALANIVRVLVLRGHHGLIGRAARRWLCADPTAKGAGATLASAWTSIVRLGEAIKIARRTLLDTPLHGRLLGTLARAELKTGAYDKAIESARRYALINPSSGYALLTLSEASVGRQDLSLCEIS